MIKKNNWRIFYPLLLGIYPVVGLVGVNISQIILLAALRSFLAACIFTLTAYAVFCWRVRDEDKAALLSAWFFVFFFFYGHFYDFAKGWKLSGLLIGRHLVIFPLWVLLFGIGGWLIYRRARDLRQVSWILNIVSLILVVVPLAEIGISEWKRGHPVPNLSITGLTVQGAAISGIKQLPDVYYIILDDYSRDDILLEYYNLDISGFIRGLEDTGFYVPRCSESNYGLTALSLSSTLNMNTVDKIVPEAMKKGATNTFNEFYSELTDSIKHSLVRKIFEEMGYKTVGFQNDVWWTEWSDADYYITDKSRPYEMVTNFNKITNFEVLFFRTTVLRIFEEASTKWLGPITKRVVSPEKQHADLVLLALDELGQVPRSVPGPKFIFAHIISPHDPYVFSPNGEFVVTTAYDPGYPNQIQYLNKRVLPLMQSIIKNSSTPPVILLMGDHGKDNEVRNVNFMAVYFPGGGKSVLYPTLTPVNIFRLVLNTYFGQNYLLLPDTSFTSPAYTSFQFTKITYPCNANR